MGILQHLRDGEVWSGSGVDSEGGGAGAGEDLGGRDGEGVDVGWVGYVEGSDLRDIRGARWRYRCRLCGL